MHYRVCPFCGTAISSWKTDSTNSTRTYFSDNAKSKSYLLIGVVCVLVLVWAILFYKYHEPTPTITLNVSSMPVYPTYNGKIIFYPSYERICPLEVKAGEGTDYYIRLKYLREAYSDVEREFISSPYEPDIAFYVESGRTVEIDVPVGVYKLYYATGHTFYGPKELFGRETSCYESDKELSFHVIGNRREGHSITLKKLLNGNFHTYGINKNKFPTE